MGLNSFLNNQLNQRNRRFNDPTFQAKLDEEWDRVKESFGRLGDQTRHTCGSILHNSLVRPFVKVKHGKKVEFNPAYQIGAGAVDSSIAAMTLVGRILMSTGRVTKYGIRHAFAV